MGWAGPTTHRQFAALTAWLVAAAGAKAAPAAEPEMTVEQAARASKARWAARGRRAT